MDSSYSDVNKQVIYERKDRIKQTFKLSSQDTTLMNVDHCNIQE